MYHISIDTDLKRNPYPGFYIALEGIDGSGKTAQIPRLKKYFEKQGREVVTTREPLKKSGLIADINQRLLLGEIDVPKEAFQYLFTVDRVLNHHENVIPALKAGKVVISDRCFWSAIPYGIWEMGQQYEFEQAKIILVAQGILAMQLQFIVPDITFYLEITTDVAMERLPQKIGEAKEIYEEKHILDKVIEGYKWLLKEFPNELTVIDAKKSIEEVTKSMVQVLESQKSKIVSPR